jgi:uncharacterized protein YukE
MAQMGMDVEAVESVGRQLKQSASSVDQIVGTLDKTVNGLSQLWEGPDAQRLVQSWPAFRKSLVAAQASIVGLGQSALNNASDQREASGAKGAGSSGLLPVTSSPHGADPAAPQQTEPHTQVGGGPDGSQHYKVHDAILSARSEVGTSRPTGFNEPGECIKSVQRWIDSAGGHFGGGGVVSGYVNSGAIEVSAADVRPGDVIQYTSISTPDQFVGGVHTVMVAGVNPDGSLDIVQSNSPGGSGLVSEIASWHPNAPAGLTPRFWRFGQQ